MTQFQITSWRDLPSMVTAREDDRQSKVLLAARFQEAIDEAAMRLGDTGADDYLLGWRRTEWEDTAEAPDVVLDRVAAELDDAWPAERIAEYLDSLGGDA